MVGKMNTLYLYNISKINTYPHRHGQLHQGLQIVAIDETHIIPLIIRAIPVNQYGLLSQMRKHVVVVANEERLRHVAQFLGVGIGVLDWRGDAVRDNVVHEGGAAGAGVAEPHHLRDRNMFKFSMAVHSRIKFKLISWRHLFKIRNQKYPNRPNPI